MNRINKINEISDRFGRLVQVIGPNYYDGYGNPLVLGMTGPTGIQGIQGIQGVTGPTGSNILSYIEWLPAPTGWQSGWIPIVVGTADNVAPSYTNLFMKQIRRRFVSSSLAGSSVVFLDTSFRHCSTGEDFTAFFIFGNEDVVNVPTARSFCGLVGGNGQLGNVNPFNISNLIGIGNSTGDVNLRFFNTASGTASIDLGANFPANTNSSDFYKLTLANGIQTGFTWRLENLHNGADTGIITVTSSIPITTLGLSPQIWRNNGTTALAVRNSLIVYKIIKL